MYLGFGIVFLLLFFSYISKNKIIFSFNMVSLNTFIIKKNILYLFIYIKTILTNSL